MATLGVEGLTKAFNDSPRVIYSTVPTELKEVTSCSVLLSDHPRVRHLVVRSSKKGVTLDYTNYSQYLLGET